MPPGTSVLAAQAPSASDSQLPQEVGFLPARLPGREQVRAPGERPPQRLPQPPAAHGAVIAADEDRRHVLAAERRRPGVLRVLEQSVGERFLVGRCVVDRSREQPDHRVDDDEGRQLAAGQDVVADRELEIDEGPDPLVDALVARADEDRGGTASARSWARSWLNGRADRDPGGSPSDSGRRSASSAAAIGSGRMTIPAPPPYGASSTLRCRPIPHSRRSCVRIWTRPRSWIRPGMLAASGPSIIAGKSVTTSISRVTRVTVVRRRSGGVGGRFGGRVRRPRRPASGCGCGGAAPSVAARRRDASAASGRAPRHRSTISPRRGAKTRTNGRTPGTSNSPYGPPATV